MREARWIVVVGLLWTAPVGAGETAVGSTTLAYVESSTGLIPPTLEGGPTERSRTRYTSSHSRRAPSLP